MGTEGWGTEHPVSEWLFKQAYRFDFYQAVRLLESMGGSNVGEGADPDSEPVRFRSHVGLDFPASDIARVERPPQGPSTMTVNFLGLAGHHGPMPSAYTETILDSVFRRDTAFRDFLDVFNHRLVSLMYRVRKTYRIGFSPARPEESHFARYFLSLMGLGTEGLSAQVPPRILLAYAGLLAQKPHTSHTLERIFCDYVGAPVHVRPFSGRWHALREDQTMALGDRNSVLGRSAVVGNKAWDQTNGFDLEVGPLRLGKFLDLLPNAPQHREAVALADFCVDRRHDFNLRLRVHSEDMPEARLSPIVGPRLGWTSWLITRPPVSPHLESVIRPRRLPPELRMLRVPLFADLGYDDLTAIRRLMRLHRLQPGTMVVREGEPARSLYVLRSGAVQLLGDSSGQGRVVLAELKGGDSFGEMDPKVDIPRRYTVVTSEPSEILELKRDDLLALAASHASIQKCLDEHLRRSARGEREPRIAELAKLLESLRIPLFEPLTSEGYAEVAEASREFTARSGTVLLQPNSPARSLFIVCQGVVRIDLHLRNGHRVTSGALEQGAVFGEERVLYSMSRRISATAVTDVEIVEITRASLMRLIERHPPVENALRTYRFRRTRKKRRNGR